VEIRGTFNKVNRSRHWPGREPLWQDSLCCFHARRDIIVKPEKTHSCFGVRGRIGGGSIFSCLAYHDLQLICWQPSKDARSHQAFCIHVLGNCFSKSEWKYLMKQRDFLNELKPAS